MSETVKLDVKGMTCPKCVAHVTEDLEDVEGVAGVSVELEPKGVSKVTVQLAGEVSDAALREAVADAGSYEVVAVARA